ncbi:P1 family peptidase [Proteiniclasticum sp. C24MP]|uniref:P1 family peptidase n=1 Tax=Proteiniclasticum sp. C24MP TaxID=3374101 RepID=UPI00375434ED
MNRIGINEIQEFFLGNKEDKNKGTGCSVILSEEGATPGVAVRGGAPGTRETDLIRSEEMIEKIHALLLSGGSAFGLDAASGVMAYLEERDIGFDTGFAKVPIVPAAVLFDLGYKDPNRRPDKNMGYEACLNARDRNYRDGSYGAGAGATVGKILGPDSAMKSGIGSYAVQIGNLKVGAVVAVNAFGTIYEGEKPIAGPHRDSQILSTEEFMIQGMEAAFKGNTTIGCILTNAVLTKSQANKLASMSHDGYARAIRPVHTMVDGDTIFVMASGREQTDFNLLGTLASMVMEKAIHVAVKNATCDTLKAYRDFNQQISDVE